MNTKRIRCSVLASLLVVTACSEATQDTPSTPNAPNAVKPVALNALTPAETAAGWMLLFDGESTDRWRGYRQDAFPEKGWIVEDDCMKVTAGGGGGDIITVDQFENFEFVLQWRVAEKANSGIMYRVKETAAAPWQTGPEYQILDDAGHGAQPTDAHSAGALYDLYTPAPGKVNRPTGEFNDTRIVINDNRLQHWLNGIKIVACELGSDDWNERVEASKFGAYEGFGVNARGHIALQDHGDDVWYRHIKIRDLSAPMPGEITLFNGKDLTGWTAHLYGDAEMSDVWSVRDGILICMGKPAGYIRTETDYTNYVLRLEWRFNPITKEAGNSGVLMRMIGEDKVWPRSVEAQLHSGNAGDFWNIDDFQMKTDPDRTRGRNTRKTHFAERPIGEWNEYEIIVDGSSIVLRVNGEVVNEAWDVQEIPGKICLQSEGAEIHFRNIRLAPIE
ncbi:MAG: DUF1080 domain-containing protein [Phycisphaerales bacterium]|nr:DUF1080 domain-containing protein [Phycisphaerales bacterium]